MTTEAQKEININIEDAKKLIKRRDALNRLFKNRDFKLVFMEGYFKEEAHRLVLLKGDPNMQSEENQKAIEASIAAIGNTYQYFNTVTQLGFMADKALEDNKQALEALNEEEE